ncbi:hypothetical protein Ndes2526B_g05711 [Nannochloris sp. 'desiccata']
MKAERLANRIESVYHKTGGDYLFVWVHDAPTFTLSFTATANFGNGLADGAGALSKFFHEANKNYVTSHSQINLWSIIGTDNIKKFMVTGPDWSHLTSKRKATERGRQPGYIIKCLNELKKEGLSFVFLYRPLMKSATETQLVICEVFPDAHAALLVNTDAWKQLLRSTNTLPPPMPTFTVATGRPAAVQTRLGPTPRQFNSAVVGGVQKPRTAKVQKSAKSVEENI